MNQPWWNVALQIYGAVMLGLPFFLWLLNKGRKQARVGISKTEGEIYKDILESRFAELNIQEIIDKKAQLIEEKYKDVIFQMQLEHFQIKEEMQKRLNEGFKEKEIVIKENDLLRSQVHEISDKYDSQERQLGNQQKEIDNQQKEIGKLTKEIEILKKQTNGH